MNNSLLEALRGDLFAGGLALMAAGWLGWALRKVPEELGRLFLRHLCVEVEIRDQDVVRWVDLWLQELPDACRRRLLKAWSYVDPEDEDGVPAVMLSPGIGTHLVRHRGRLALVIRHREDAGPGGADRGGDLASLIRPEHIRLIAAGRDPAFLRGLVEEARATANRSALERGQVQVHVNRWQEWRAVDAGRPRPLESVVMPRGVAEAIVGDAGRFLAAGRREWYHHRGIPYRRGYLLHGPPGGGKSSLVRALASELGLRLYLLDLTDRELTDLSVARLLASVPARSLVLVEDVDCLAPARRRGRRRAGEDNGEGRVTLSGFLNATDGVIAGEGRILVLTTNRPGELDPALVRDGRIDLSVEVAAPVPEQAERLFLRFHPGAGSEARRFADFAPRMPGASMAMLQGILVRHADPAGAVAAAGERAV